MSQVQIHEIGHSLGQLADEYDYPNSTYTGSEPSQVISGGEGCCLLDKTA